MKKPPDNIPEYANRFRKLLNQKKLTFKELAALLYVNPNYLSMIACGKRKMTADMARRIATVLPDVRPQWLLCLDDYMTEADRTKETLEFHRTLEDLTEELILAHGYELSVIHSGDNNVYILQSPDGKQKRIPELQYNHLITCINDYIEGQLLLGFHEIHDVAKQYRGGVF